ncbi:MAG: hypothetical protein M1823_001742 [Watsoniomyces obsoletus]|nr:MAG: hypothetical protein M1823_001742 [Watsoniomyces obsoletus]
MTTNGSADGATLPTPMPSGAGVPNGIKEGSPSRQRSVLQSETPIELDQGPRKRPRQGEEEKNGNDGHNDKDEINSPCLDDPTVRRPKRAKLEEEEEEEEDEVIPCPSKVPARSSVSVSSHKEREIASAAPKKEAWCSRAVSVASWVEQVVSQGTHLEPPPEEHRDTVETEADGMSWDAFTVGERISRTASTTSSPYDPFYRDRLKKYNISIEDCPTPEAKWNQAITIMQRAGPGLGPDLGQNKLEKLARLSIELASAGETTIIEKLHTGIIPILRGENQPSVLADNRNQPWTGAVPVPDVIGKYKASPPLSIPKPDVIIGYDVLKALNPEQQSTASLFELDPYYLARPDNRVFCPFLGMDFKSVAKRNTRYIAENQQANAGAIALYALNIMSSYAYGGGNDLSAHDAPLFFSVTGDNEIATVHVHWVGKDGIGRLTYNSSRLETYILRRPDEIKAYALAVDNIIKYGATELLAWLRTLLDDCGRKFEDTGKHPLEGMSWPSRLKRTRSTTNLPASQ